MKYISFSFDDARSYIYVIAKPIMKKHGLIGTVNVIRRSQRRSYTWDEFNELLKYCPLE